MIEDLKTRAERTRRMGGEFRIYYNTIHGRVANGQGFGRLDRDMRARGYDPTNEEDVARYFSEVLAIREGDWKSLKDVIKLKEAEAKRGKI